MFALRTSAARSAISGTRAFSRASALRIKAGDAFPEATLMEDSPGNKLSLAKLLKDQERAIVVGVPAAFSPACSSTHVPGYVAANSGLPTYIVSVNDPFVMKAWKDSLIHPTSSAGPSFRFLADPSGELTRALDMEFDSAHIFGNNRAKRFALVVEKGTVKHVFAEPDNTGVDVSAAEKVLKALA
ncbi:AhpC/TSA family protein [Pyronema omphalodes]|nr:AhpC/TSA family protein [Pyronema omphalodes]